MRQKEEPGIKIDRKFSKPEGLGQISFPCMPSLKFKTYDSMGLIDYGENNRNCLFKIEHNNPELKNLKFNLKYKSGAKYFNFKAVQVIFL